MIHHSLRTLDSQSLAWNISENILNAHGAVVIFFVLSGYVLAKSLLSRDFNVSAVTKFYMRRAFRIYPALWLAIAVGMFYAFVIRPLSAPHMSIWMSKYYEIVVFTFPVMAEAIAGLNAKLLPTAWTITIEIVASVVLPLVVVVLRAGRLAAIALLLVMTLVSFGFGVSARQVPLYMVDFVLGAMLATSPWLQRVQIGTVATAVAAIVLLFFRRVAHWDYHDPLPSLVEALASVVLISAITQHRVKWLKNQALVKIGDWSYSIYLLHLPIALIATRLVCHFAGEGNLDLLAFVIMILTVGVTLPLSVLAYKYVESPGISLGARGFQALESRVFARLPKAAG